MILFEAYARIAEIRPGMGRLSAGKGDPPGGQRPTVCRPTLKLRQIEQSAIKESQGRQLRFDRINLTVRDVTQGGMWKREPR